MKIALRYRPYGPHQEPLFDQSWCSVPWKFRSKCWRGSKLYLKRYMDKRGRRLSIAMACFVSYSLLDSESCKRFYFWCPAGAWKLWFCFFAIRAGNRVYLLRRHKTLKSIQALLQRFALGWKRASIEHSLLEVAVIEGRPSCLLYQAHFALNTLHSIYIKRHWTIILTNCYQIQHTLSVQISLI